MQKISGFQAKRFTQIRKNSIQLSDIELVQTELLDSNRTFPLVIKPIFLRLICGVGAEQPGLHRGKAPAARGPALRGFVVNSPKDFEQFAEPLPESVRKL